MIVGVKRAVRSNFHHASNPYRSFIRHKLAPCLNVRVRPNRKTAAGPYPNHNISMQLSAVTKFQRTSIPILKDGHPITNENVRTDPKISMFDGGAGRNISTRIEIRQIDSSANR